MKRVIGFAGPAAAVLAAILLARLPAVSALAAQIDAHESRLLMIIAIVLALGLTLFLGGIIKLLMDQGEVLSRAEIESLEESVRMTGHPASRRVTRYRLFGVAEGRRGSESFRLLDLKGAFRSGAAWRDTDWRRRIVTIAGALLLIVGLLGGGIVVGPPWIKALLAGTLLYVVGMLVWGWRRTEIL